MQPDFVAAADVGDVLQRVEGPGGRGAGTRDDCRRSADSAPAGGPIPRPTVADPCAPARPVRPARSAGCRGRGCPRLEPRCNGRRREPTGRAAAPSCANPSFPHVAQSHIAGGQQGREVGEGSAVRDRSGKGVGRPADGRAEFPDHGLLDGRRPRAHLVDGHHLVGDRTDGVEQPGDRHGRRHLVADVAGVVQVQPPLEHDLDEAGEVIGHFRHGRGPRRRRSGAGAACSSAAASRIPSGGSTHGNTGPSDRSARARWAASNPASRWPASSSKRGS